MKHSLSFVAVFMLFVVACQKTVKSQEVMLEVSIPEVTADSTQKDVNKDLLMADIRKVIAQRLEVEEKDIRDVEGHPNWLSVNMSGPVDTASIDRLLSQRGEFGFWETYLSKDIANVIMEGIKKIKDGDRLISLLNLVSNDYCILGYVQEKDTAEVNRLLQSPEIRQQLGPDVRLYWGYQEERVSRGLFSNDETNMEDSESAFYGLFCVRGQSPVITGDKIIDAKDEMDSFNHSPIVTMKMNEEGARLFTDMTKKNIGLPIALVMDGRVYSGPRVNMEITGGNASISGQYTPEQTKELALILKSGILKGSAKVIVDKK